MASNFSVLPHCHICNDDFTDPRWLPCLHTFCLKCLKGHFHGRYPGEKVTCPLCMREFQIPDRGLDDIPKDFNIRDFVVSNARTNKDDDNRRDSMVDYQLILQNNYRLISRSLVVTNSLLADLSTEPQLVQTIKDIQQQQSASNKMDTLLNTLCNVPQQYTKSVFARFLKSLRQDGQEHVANIFRPQSDVRHMSDEHHMLLIDKRRQICQCLDPVDGLTDELVSCKVFSDIDRDAVLGETGLDGMSGKVVDILLRKEDGAFKAFIQSLCTTNQKHVASLLGHDTTSIPMTREHWELLSTKKKNELCQFMDPSINLLNELLYLNVFSTSDVERVRSKKRNDEIVLELVNILLRKSDSSFDKFIEALNNTEQQHVVHILTGQGEVPLSRVRRLVLRKARDRFVSRVDTLHTSLLAKLISSGVLNDSDKQRIEAHTVNENRTAELIDVIGRKSQTAYDKFLQALKDSGHQQIAEELEGLELRGTVDPHFFSDTSPTERNKIFRVLRNNMKALVGGTGPDIEEFTSVMEQNGFAVSEITEGSIHISFRCFTKESLVNLKRLYTNKTLDKLFTKVFCPELVAEGLESLTLDIADYEFYKCLETFKQMKLKAKNKRRKSLKKKTPKVGLQLQHISLIHLPTRLLELVLMRTFLLLFKQYKSLYKTRVAVSVAYNSLATVCCHWWKTMCGCPESSTVHHRAFKYICRPYFVSPSLLFSLPMSNEVWGVTRCDKKLFVICLSSNIIHVIGPNNEPATDIKLTELNSPLDIVSCTETKQLYIADWSRDSTRCVWRVSLDGREVTKWLPGESTTASTFKPWTLSLRSRRLLVTPADVDALLLYGADGAELKRILLSDMNELHHAVETSRETFIVSHQQPQPRVCEVNSDGHLICVYNYHKTLGCPIYLALHSDNGVFVADCGKRRVLLLNSLLKQERVLLDKSMTTNPLRLCYTEETGYLAVAGLEINVHLTGCNWSGCMQTFIV